MKSGRPQRKQPTPPELIDTLLSFVKTHFYQGQPVAFAKDRPRILEWVVLKLAVYLNERAVWLPLDRYRQIMMDGILMPALRHGDTGNITYLPAWLGRAVDSHLHVHGEKYYDEGKTYRESIGTHISGALQIAQAGIGGRDAIREMADAARLLKAPKKAIVKPTAKDQLSLF